ncbi:MAG: DUF4376 domain-containing protein [Pseudomonadota bacterium]
MFSKDQTAGRVVCLADYGRVKAGAIVPERNELYADVEDWLAEGNTLADFDGYPDTRPLDEIRKAQQAVIEQARDAAIEGGFEHDFNGTLDTVQTRQRDRENITGLAVSAQRHPDATFQFRAGSNTTYELSADDMLALADAAQQHVSEQYATSWQLKADISAAETVDAIKAVVWPE